MNRSIIRIFGIALAVAFATSLVFAQTPASRAAAQTAAPTKAATAAKAPTKATLIDINSASLSDLATLPGIGDVLAKKIVDGRPYKSKNQLTSKKILTAAQYKKIADQIIAKQGK
jgi:competence protein ComEA